MSIRLKRVELSNIRTHGHVIFQPEQDGITAISGPNGSGKSTIVDSIVWALYGVKPEGVSKNSSLVKMGVNIEKGKVESFVSMNISIDSREIKVRREIVDKGKTVQCDVWEIDHDENGEIVEQHKAGPAVSSAELYIRRFMKMDHKGFLSAILVQQKQVDNLISATAQKRAQVIEKLIGISSITKALESARKDGNELKNDVKKADVNEDDFKKLVDLKEKEEKNLEKSQKLHQNLQEKLEKAQESNTSIKEKVELESNKSDEFEALKNTINTLKAQITAQEDNLEAVIKDKDSKKEKLSQVESGASLDELEPKIKEYKTQLRTLENEKSSMVKELNEAKTELKKAQEVIEKSSIKTDEEAQKGMQKTEEQLSSFEIKINDSRAEIVSAESEMNKLDKAIKVLLDGHGTCPTCLQHVDDVTSVVDTLKGQKVSIENKKEEETTNVEQYNKSILKVNLIIEKFNQLIQAISVNEIVAETIEEEEQEIQRHSGLIKAAEAEFNAFDKIYQAAKRKGETKKEYEALLQRAKNISNDINEKTKQLEIAEKEMKNSGVISVSALAKLRKQFDESVEFYNETHKKESDVRVDLNVSIERVKNLTEKVENYSQKLEEHRDLLKSVEVATSTTKIIEEFREDRITNSVPVIEVYASDLLSRFTDGAFTRLKIDSKFNATVVRSNGVESPVGLLSGGELSAAAIALRLSVSMLLNGGGSDNLIILDEVLVSQDENRSSLILSTIKEVCKGQVILVAHNSITDEISDRVVELR